MTSKKYNPLTVLKKIVALNKRFLLRFLLLGLVAFFVSLTGIFQIEGIRIITNSIVEMNVSVLVKGGFLALSGMILQELLLQLIRIGTERLHNLSVTSAQKKLLEKLNVLESTSYDTYSTSDLVSKIFDSAENSTRRLNQTSLNFVLDFFILLTTLTYIGFASPALAIGALLIAVMLPLLSNVLSDSLRNNTDDVQSSDIDIQSFLFNTLRDKESVRVFNARNFFQQKYTKLLQNNFSIKQRSFLITSISGRLFHIVMIVGLIYIMGYGGFLYLNGKIDLGIVIAFSTSYTSIVFPISSLSQVWVNLQEAISNGNRMIEILDLDTKELNKAVDHSTSDKLNDSINFNNVSVTIDGKPILEDLTFTIPKGKATAIIGPSGAGKTTLIKLILKQLKPTSGDIYYGNINQKSLSQKQIFNSIGYVPQKSIIFEDTIENNLMIPNEKNLDERAIMNKLSLLNLDKFVSGKKEGLKTKIHEDNLSGGEKKRLMIAKILFQEKSIIILDEPSAYLDARNEEKVAKLLKTEMESQTKIIISHNDGVIQEADLIIRLENGKIKT
ncbi:ATP-binding cassette domain-containing protein [Alkalibacterium sp. f15]|uniref:ATP-binding cassette domain-containing protein n=1 Tax=Alkalibacterium sp. f15 TaxID=3414029 RepID=UPI003BF7D1B2